MKIDFADIRNAVIGEGISIPGPFGPRPLLYADYVASGRALSFIEDAVRDHVLPYYGNTHTETSYTGRRSTQLREMARNAVRNAVGADDDHAVIFTGSGATSAVDKLVRVLQMQWLDETSIVFVGPFEHHSNELPWRETGSQVVRIPLASDGSICLQSLKQALEETAQAKSRIGAFSAASNVTGVRSDVRALARLLHKHGGWFACDYAAAAPYGRVHLAETAPGADDRIDAAFISPHKYPGGPGASGLLIADKELLATRRPSVAGGGTVSYVTSDHHTYVEDVERREEAGTPAIIENIRAGMVLQLKRDMDERAVEKGEADMTARLHRALRNIPGVEVLGPESAERIGIFSFNIRVGERLLHHNYVVALLNDLFGIQARGGCSCAGPYGHTLLGIDQARTKQHEEAVLSGLAAYRPGWARVGVNYFFSEQDVDTIATAIAFIAEHGRSLLPLYRLDVHAGVWRVRHQKTDIPPSRLSDLWLHETVLPDSPPDFDASLDMAKALVTRAQKAVDAPPITHAAVGERLRWFWMPHEARFDIAGAA